MRITEAPLTHAISSNLEGAAAEGAKLAGTTCDAEPIQIVEAINSFIVRSRKAENPEIDNWTDRALPLGSLWATQIVRQFGWEWAGVTQHDLDNRKAIGIFDRRRSLAIYPFDFIFHTLESRSYPTILLAFNMLLGGKIPELSPGGYVNLMDGVRHIVPPE